MGSPFDNNHRMDMRAPFISSRTRAAKMCQNIRRESVERRKTQESIDEHRDRLLLYSSTVEPLGNAGDELSTYVWNLEFSIHLFDEDASDYVAVSLARERVCSLIHLWTNHGPIPTASFGDQLPTHFSSPQLVWAKSYTQRGNFHSILRLNRRRAA